MGRGPEGRHGESSPTMMDSSTLRRRDTTKGTPLRILSLGA